MRRWLRWYCWLFGHTPNGSSGHVQFCVVCDGWRGDLVEGQHIVGPPHFTPWRFD